MKASRSCRACASRRKCARASCCEVKVKEMEVDRKIRLVYPARRALSHAAQAFLDLVLLLLELRATLYLFWYIKTWVGWSRP